MDARKIERAVKACLPDKFLIAAMRVVFAARKQAHEHCVAEFAEQEYHNVAPYYLRGKTEGLIRGAAALYPQFTAEVINCSGWRHTEITSGIVKLTVHAVESPCAVLDMAEYRRTLADSQPALFGSASPAQNAMLYALLLHSPYLGRSKQDARQYRYLPGSAYLAFPDKALKGYTHRINLFDRYPKDLSGLLPKEWDQKAHVSYRRQARQRVA